MDNISTNIGDILLIKLVEPYKKINKILSYEDVVEGETTFSYYTRYFRYSTTNKTYSDWEFLTNENLQNLEIDSTKDFWIQYKYEVDNIQTGDELKFISISLEVVNENGAIVDMPCIEFCGEDCPPGSNLIIDDCCENDSFDPYNVTKGIQNYNQLSSLVSNIFGFEATYYKTDPNKNSEDVVLKEYSLYNVSAVNCVKIMFPDNEFPTTELAFKKDHIEVPDELFEIHIVKEHFESIFGSGARPAEFDYMLIPALQNRVFEVNSVSNPDETLMQYSTYYRVMLRDYQDRQMIEDDEIFSEEVQEEVDSFKEMIRSTETELGEEIRQEQIKVRKPLQYNTIGTNELDYVRADIDPKLNIREEKIKNNYTVISKYNYELSSILKDSVALTYRYRDGLYSNENRALTFWIRPKFIAKDAPNVLIESVTSDNEGFANFTTEIEHNYNVGDIIRITGTGDYNGIHTVTRVESLSFSISALYNSDTLINPRSKMLTVNKFLLSGNNNSEFFNIMYGKDSFYITNNDSMYVFDLKEDGVLLNNNIWYGITINLSNEFKQLSLFIWTTNNNGRVNISTESGLLPVYSKTYTINNPITIEEDVDWQVIGNEGDFTNFRIFTQPIELEQQSIMLSQYIVIDSHLSVLCDNAVPGIRLDRKTNPR